MFSTVQGSVPLVALIFISARRHTTKWRFFFFSLGVINVKLGMKPKIFSSICRDLRSILDYERAGCK